MRLKGKYDHFPTHYCQISRNPPRYSIKLDQRRALSAFRVVYLKSQKDLDGSLFPKPDSSFLREVSVRDYIYA